MLPKLGLPSTFLTPLLASPLDTLKIILPYAITMAAVGSIESLLTLQLLDGIIDDGKRGSTKKEVIGQGIGNFAAGMTGGIGGCALIGQSLISAQSGGGVSRLSGISMAIFLALGIVSFAPLLGETPVCVSSNLTFDYEDWKIRTANFHLFLLYNLLGSVGCDVISVSDIIFVG